MPKEPHHQHSPFRDERIVWAAAAGAVGVIGGLGFALWFAEGRAVVHAMGEQLLAWCL